MDVLTTHFGLFGALRQMSLERNIRFYGHLLMFSGLLPLPATPNSIKNHKIHQHFQRLPVADEVPPQEMLNFDYGNHTRGDRPKKK